METVVDMRLGARALVVVIDNGAQGLAAHLHGERHHGGVAAAERRQGAAAKIIGRAAPGPGLLIHVAVAVHAARQHQPSGGIDDLARLQGLRPNVSDQAIAHADIRPRGAFRQHDRPAANGEVVDIGRGVIGRQCHRR